MLKDLMSDKFLVLFVILLFGLSCSRFDKLVGLDKGQKEIVKLPTENISAETDDDIVKETSVVIDLTVDNKLYQQQIKDVTESSERTIDVISRDELSSKLKSSTKDKAPEKRIVYLKCDVNATVESVLQVFDIIKTAEIDKIGLVVAAKKSDSETLPVIPARFEVTPRKLPTSDAPMKPNPLTLIAALDTNGKLKLNNEEMGTLFESKELAERLLQIFEERGKNGLFREGTNEVEKTVILKVSKSRKYGEFIKLVNAVRSAGAQPIEIQIEDLGF